MTFHEQFGKKPVKIDAKFVVEARSRLAILDSRNQIYEPEIKNLVVQRFALFIQESDEKYHYFLTEKDKHIAKKKVQADLFLLFSECRKDMDKVIGHVLVESLFGTDIEAEALYSQ